MRQVIFTNRIFPNAKKREVCVEETVNENGHTSKIRKRSLYFIRNILPMETPEKVKEWLDYKKEHPEHGSRRFHVMKIHSDKGQIDTVLCKAKGSFYVVCNNDVYSISYLHCLRLEVAAAA